MILILSWVECLADFLIVVSRILSKFFFSSSERLEPSDGVPLEAVVEQEVGETVIEVGPQTHQPVGLVWVTDLPATKKKVPLLYSLNSYKQGQGEVIIE